uniref:Centrosomal protein of 72 kDa n=1 Tax=Periophthalmus magnuspinnatus TaxID=409849 RepID=A0A3B4ADU5_9GOBI
MAAELITLTEQWIRDKLQLTHPCLGDVRSLSLPGTYEQKIQHLGSGLKSFIRLKSLDLSCNALVSVEGVQHLKTLERLILYYNAIPSLDELKVLFELPVLRELDVRLNPLTKRDPQYRPYIVHAMPKLRKLDGCPVRDTDRKVAIMKFSSDDLPQKDACYLIMHCCSVFFLISQGSYRKPLEMLLNLVDKHWRGERSLHQNNNFLSQAVQILSLMESSISSREAEIKNLRQQIDSLNSKAAAKEEQHKTEIQNLTSQLQEAHVTGKLNEQLRIVLEENVSLQRQLIKLEKQYLKSMIKTSPRTQIQGIFQTINHFLTVFVNI